MTEARFEPNPTRYDVDPETGCFIWRGATINGYPIANWNGKRDVIARLLQPDITSDEQAHMTCENKLCVNRAHAFRGPSNRPGYRPQRSKNALLTDEGQPAKHSWEKGPGGCHLWIGALGRDGAPVASFNRKMVRVRQTMLGVEKGTIIRTTCGVKLCVNPKHLYIPVEYHAMIKQTKRTNAEATWDPAQPRDMGLALSDLKDLVDHAEKTGSWPKLTEKMKLTAKLYALGQSLSQIAKREGVSKQAVSLRLKIADQRLRAHRLQR